jgi:hypothetical protein
MARASSAIVKEMLPLIDSTYAVRTKYLFLKYVNNSEKIGDNSTYKESKIKAWVESAIGAKNAKSEVETKADLLKDYTAASIDALTRGDIFETVMWPKISAYSPGWFDPPESTAQNPLLSSMRGVVYKTVYEGVPATDFKSDFHKLFGKTAETTMPPIGYLDQTSQLATDFAKLNKLCEELGNNFSYDLTGYENINNKKEFLKELFSNENAVKLYFIETILFEKLLASPFSAMAVDPYYGYLLMFAGWIGGTGVMSLVKGKMTYQGSEQIVNLKTITEGASYGLWKGADDVNWTQAMKSTDGKEKSARAYLPNYATNFLECFAAWLQSTKTEKPEYYKTWYDKLITDRFSMINMLVLINELVNVPGPTNRFIYNPDASNFLSLLSEKYKTFEITIGD